MLTKSNVLLDTNILVYAIQPTSEFHARSQAFLRNPTYEFWTTSKNLVEFFAVVTKGEVPILTYQEAMQAIKVYPKRFLILYPTPGSIHQWQTLLATQPTKGLRVHDAETAAIGLANGVSTVATFNTDDFKGFGEVTLLTP